MSVPIELSIHVSNEDKRSVHKHLIYEPFKLSLEDETLMTLVNDAIDAFKDEGHSAVEVDNVVIKTKLVWQ